MEAEAGGPLRDCFDLIGGTSVGGILAIGVAAGVPAATLRLEIERRGPAIFRSRLLSVTGLLSARYGAEPLAAAIDAILSPAATAPFASLPARVPAVAIDQRTGQPKIFRSDALAPGAGDRTQMRDAALATSAAPTFFPAHRADGTTYVDGGLIANAPDLMLAAEAIRHFSVDLDALKVFAVGTSGSPRAGLAMDAPGKLAWIARHDLAALSIDAQARLATDQFDRLLPAGVMRVDGRPRKPIAMDDASRGATRLLVELAETAFGHLKATRAAELRAMLAR